MNLIITGVFLFALSIIVLSFINLKLSVVIYISYLILVPYLQFNIAGLPLSYNLVNTLLFSVFIYHSLADKQQIVNYQVIIPFLFLFFSLLIISIFASGMPWNLQFNVWRASFMQTCLISFVVWNLALFKQKFLLYFQWGFLISITVAGIYGVLLMKLEGLNPYISILSDYFGMEDFSLHFNEMETRLDFSSASKIQSTMAHPMTWTLVLCFSIIILWAIYSKTDKRILWILILLVSFNIFISGVRTGIAALTIGFIYFLIRNRNIKLIIFTLFTVVIFALVVQSNDSLANIFKSFTDFSGENSNVNGSSITMRIEQFQGTLNEIKDNELVGNGYGWTGYYMSINGKHPVILAFESIIFMVLCNSGYLGLLVWILFFLLLFLLNRRILNLKTDILLADTFIIVYAAYATGTGEYGYMSFFAFFYSFLLAYLLKSSKSRPLAEKSNNNKFIKFELLK